MTHDEIFLMPHASSHKKNRDYIEHQLSCLEQILEHDPAEKPYKRVLHALLKASPEVMYHEGIVVSLGAKGHSSSTRSYISQKLKNLGYRVEDFYINHYDTHEFYISYFN